MDDSDEDDIDEEAFKEALEKAKAAAEKLSERPRSKKWLQLVWLIFFAIKSFTYILLNIYTFGINNGR